MCWLARREVISVWNKSRNGRESAKSAQRDVTLLGLLLLRYTWPTKHIPHLNIWDVSSAGLVSPPCSTWSLKREMLDTTLQFWMICLIGPHFVGPRDENLSLGVCCLDCEMMFGLQVGTSCSQEMHFLQKCRAVFPRSLHHVAILNVFPDWSSGWKPVTWSLLFELRNDVRATQEQVREEMHCLQECLPFVW